MKKLIVGTILGTMLLAPAFVLADASEQGCKSSDNQPKSCKDTPSSVPEPGVLMLLGAGLLGVAGYVVLRNKKANQPA